MSYQEFIQSIKESRPNVWFEYSERHHIIPRCLGGTDDKENLIYLTYKEHFIAHKLLAEENPENEKLCYAYWRTCNGRYNCTPGEYESARVIIHDILKGQVLSDEVRKKMSESAKRRANTLEYKEKFSEFMTGRTHTEETKKKIAESSRGRVPIEDTRKKISEAKIGHEVSDDTKAKIAFAASHISDETRLKMINAAHDREPFNVETRRKMSESHKGNANRLGKSFTSEQIEKISRNRKGITGIEYHLICKNCNSEFISTGPGGKYCKNCKEKLNG